VDKDLALTLISIIIISERQIRSLISSAGEQKCGQPVDVLVLAE